MTATSQLKTLEIKEILVKDDQTEKGYHFTNMKQGEVVFNHGILIIQDRALRALWGGRNTIFRGGGRRLIYRHCPQCPAELPTTQMRDHLRKVHNWKWKDVREFNSPQNEKSDKSVVQAKSYTSNRTLDRDVNRVDLSTTEWYGQKSPVYLIRVVKDDGEVFEFPEFERGKVSVSESGVVFLPDDVLRSGWADRARSYSEREKRTCVCGETFTSAAAESEHKLYCAKALAPLMAPKTENTLAQNG